MNSKVEQSKGKGAASSSDIVKYIIAVALVLAGLFVWFWFGAPARSAQLGVGEWAPQVRGAAVIAGLLAGIAVFMLTQKGRDAREFLFESRFELRKVVWPTRQEATRMTWVVVIVVVILSLLLWSFDYFIQWAVQKFLSL